MSAKRQIVLLVLVLVLSVSGLQDSSTHKRRAKRYLGFVDKTKVFVRFNTKHNIIENFYLFAQGTGFRANFDIDWKEGHKRRHKIIKRDLYKSLEQLVNQHGFDGRACVLKTLCEASTTVTPQSGILFKLFKKIFTLPEGDDEYYPYLNSEKCEELDHHCPMSLLQLTRYTDG